MRGEGARELVFVGTAPGARSKGIQTFRLQTEDLEVSQNITLAPLGQAPETAGAGFFAIDPKRRFLFTLDKQVGSFAVDGKTGKLTAIDRKPAPGSAHLIVDDKGQALIVAGGDALAVLSVSEDGHLGAPVTVSLGGKARALGLAFDGKNGLILVCDGGQDRVQVFRLEGGKLKAVAILNMKPGFNPKRAAFRPDGKFAYVIGARSTVAVLSCDPAGKLAEVGSASTVPEYYDGPNEPSEIAVHPSEPFLYVSNRGHNSVVLFGIDEGAGTVSFVEEQGTGGKSPNHFGIAPNAKHLALGNQDSDTVLVCRVDGGNGRLKPSGVFTTVPSPTCVRFL